ncbi:sister chromatid cohesion 1 protein 3-like [Andrographis paniculata]|uniref:sister chromatid cohesion 1 protein 3-like n=1 Tax=Andrographis paniculata TaxID=175694 RepID=UPI0021E940D3|nr:sister chromatid cohesion 1 protein 3-like [Andrographis paniculata]
MFYSHTFLARKGPLGTVWCAAHLQHKLKKSHYISTNVPKTVDRIMYPEVPLALRMSGHLLVGVVRIYSKQVDYLFEDCNVIRTTINRILRKINVNLPEDATQATFHSVTLPENFNLDSIELDSFDTDWQQDYHLKSLDEITLTEQIPTGQDPYIVISFQEHELPGPPAEENLGSGPAPMDEEPPVEAAAAAAAEFQATPSKQLGTDDRSIGSISPQELPSIEIMRDARQSLDFTASPMLSDRAEPDAVLEEQINKDKEINTPHSVEVPLPGGSVSSPQAHEKPPSFGRLGSPIAFEHQSNELQIQPTPPVAKPQIRRKRKQFFDETIILSNPFIQKGLNDTSDICRKRKNCPTSSLAIWNRNNRLRLRKDGLFLPPYPSGSCSELQDIYKKDAISVKFPPVPAEEAHQETTADQPSVSRHGDDMEIEIPRNNEYASPNRQIPDITNVLPSPSERDHSAFHNLDTGLHPHREATEEEEALPTASVGASSGMLDSEIRTPDSVFGKSLQAEHTVLSNISEFVASPGELRFLDQEDNSPAGSQGTPASANLGTQGTPELHALSSRTRAVAQYLKRQASATPASSSAAESSEDLSLNKILEGKTRKICARMFYQALVLKSNDLVDVHQEVPYGDITLKVTPKLSKEQFSI